MIRGDKSDSLSATSLAEVGHRGQLGIDRPGLKIKVNAILNLDFFWIMSVANPPSSKPPVVEVIDSLLGILFLLELHINVPNLI